MPPLPSDLRKTLENAIVAARRVAEEAARASLTTLAVARPEPFATMDEAQRSLRRGLRAKARQLGDDTKTAALPLLTYEVAYQQWHRMLFARFLAENGLLMHPTLGVPVSLAECAELAAEEGAADAWDLAARYAAAMLPGIFPADDPAVQVRFAAEGQQRLETILAGLPPAVFSADDGLGWVYQFWQTKKKEEVNASGRKIGGADLAPVTQLFTEDYMVRFLLENSLGAWWAARRPDSPLLKTFTYLRYRDDGAPAAGTFPGWPDRAAAITCMDPCGGSGHFVVAEFEMLRRMRMAEEGLDARAAGDAVIRDNLFMLELDPRCTQIATFSLALAAWRSGGYRPLPAPNIACSGLAVTGQLEDWLRLARGDGRLRAALERLHRLFTNAPTLGSLINPADVPLNERMFSADYEEVAPLLARALARERDDPAAAVLGAAAEGVAKAAKLLARQYTLVATNVPYLGLNRQSDTLKVFANLHHRDAVTDLATVFIDRCRMYAVPSGSLALVVPQYWLFLGSYTKLRKRFLRDQTWNHAARLGTSAFDTIGGAIVNVALLVLTVEQPQGNNVVTGLDCSEAKTATEKALQLRMSQMQTFSQISQLLNPDGRITFSDSNRSVPMLAEFTRILQGVGTTDTPRYVVRFWEVSQIGDTWTLYQLAPDGREFSGYTALLRWENGKGELAQIGTAHKGKQAVGERGFAIAVTQTPKVAAFLGTRFDCTMAALLVKNPDHYPAIRSFLLSDAFPREVRRVDQALSITESSFIKVPFDLIHWQDIANAAGPPPEPYSNDPTQWLFTGHPVGATEPLQVAVARLLGYRWPGQVEGDRLKVEGHAGDGLEAFADADGIVCLPAVAGEAPAAERLRGLLAAAYGDAWSAAEQERLLAAVGFTGKTLDDWLADGFFAQHCKLFHNRPFIWHAWDGRKDGFSALVNYHRLDRPALEKLTYTYLGAWITRQRGERDAGVPAADGRLVAALALQKKLVAILEGEPPFDIYVRWKPLEKQPVGWAPDLNDGVRLNIRPFVTAGVLRGKFTINWNKDRGANPDGSERVNDRHVTRAEKEKARAG